MTTAEYNHCVEKYADNVYRFILKNVKNTSDAEDIVQNAFEILWKKHGEVEGAKAKSYLFTVAYNNMIDTIRRGKKMAYMEEIKSRDTVNMSYTGAKEAVETALKQLPEVQRTVVMLRDYEGYSYEEIGEIAGLTESQVKVYIFRARKALQTYLVSVDKVV